jgi:hypothetical protein
MGAAAFSGGDFLEIAAAVPLGGAGVRRAYEFGAASNPGYSFSSSVLR